MNTKSYLLILILILFIAPTFAQKKPKKDTLTLNDMYIKLVEIENSIHNLSNADVKTDKSKKNDNENKLKDQEKKIKVLTDSVSDLNGKIKKLKEDISVEKKYNTELKSEKNNAINQEKINLQDEIKTLLSQEYTFPLDLLNIIETRVKKLTSTKPDNYEKFAIFKDAYTKINEAYKLLEAPFDCINKNTSLSELNNLKLDEKLFLGLNKNKDLIISLLDSYNSTTKEIAKIIIDYSSLNEEKRREKLNGKDYIVSDYPFLKLQLKKALEDKNFKIATTDCK